MEQIGTSGSTSAASSFAGLLASLAAPQKKSPPEWNEDGLADDIATLSYEQALRTLRPWGQNTEQRAVAPEPASEPWASASSARSIPDASASPGRSRSASQPHRSLKRASITIRLSEAESAQLHRRAAEAGLTVSAYLRSCTLEVESLRAQVKETLAQLRSATSTPSVPRPAVQGAAASNPGPWRRFWPFRRNRQTS
jgi:predicted DNA binding CopG/RHH family protein